MVELIPEAAKMFGDPAIQQKLDQEAAASGSYEIQVDELRDMGVEESSLAPEPPVYQGVNPDQDISRVPQSLAPGLEEEQNQRNAGFTEDEIAENRRQKIEQMKAADFSDQEIQDHYGIKQPDMANFKAKFDETLTAANAAEKEKAANSTATGPAKPQKPQHPAQGFLEAFEAGWDGSVAGLFTAGLPDTVLPEDASLAMNIAAAAGQFLGDAPTFLAGMSAGTTLTAGNVIVGAGAGFAVTEAYRDILMQHYMHGDINSASEFATRAVGTAWKAAKGFVVGAATEFVGGRAGAKVLAKTGKQFLSDGARFIAELPVMVGLAKGLEGEMPNRNDFITGGVVLGGFHGARYVAPKLMQIYKETGNKPSEVLEAAQSDVILRQEVVAQDSNITPFQKQGLAPPELSGIAPMVKDVTTRFFKGLRQEVFDSIAPAKEIGEGSYKFLDSQKTWNSRVGSIIEDGTISADRLTRTGEGLKPIVFDGMKALKGRELTPEGAKLIERIPELKDRRPEEQILEAYLAARTAKERFEKTPEKATGIDYETAKKFLDDHKDLEPIAKRFTSFTKEVLKYGAEAGIFSKESVNRMMDAHEMYAPLGRDVQPDPLTGQGSKGKPAKAFKGSDAPIRSPIQVTIENISSIVRAVEENQSRLKIKQELENNPNAAELGRVVKPKSKSTSVDFEEVQAALEMRGVDDVQMPSGKFKVWRKEHGPLKDNQIPFYEDGKMGLLELRADIAEGIKSLDYKPGFTSLALGTAVDIAKASATFAKKSITLSPAFAERNIVRDQLESFINTGNQPVIPTVEALSHISGRDPVFQRYLLSGALTEGFYGFKDYALKFQETLKETGVTDNIRNQIKNPKQAFRAWEELLASAETAPRIAAAKKAGLMEAKSLEQLIDAGFASKESTVNFLKVGLRTRAVAPLFKFLAPGLAGIERNVRGLSDAQVWERGFYALTLPTVVNWMANRDDSRYKALPPYKLATGVPILTDKWEPAVNQQDWVSRPEDLRRMKNGKYEVNNGTVFMIPKPHGYGLLFSTIPEAALNKIYGTNPEAFKNFDKTILSAFMPDMSVNIALPFIEMGTNQNMFTGNPIVPYHMKDALPEEQWLPYTSEFAKQLGKVIGNSFLASDIGKDGLKIQSPLVIDTFIRDWTGPTGVAAIQLVDKALHAAGVGNQTAAPYTSLFENTFVNGFVYRFPNARVQDIERFYDRLSRNKGVARSFSLAKQRQDGGRMQEILDQYQEYLTPLDNVQKSLSAQNKTIQAITSGIGEFKKIPAVEKRQMIDTIYYQMWQEAQQANKQLDVMEAEIKKMRKQRQIGP